MALWASEMPLKRILILKGYKYTPEHKNAIQGRTEAHRGKGRK